MTAIQDMRLEASRAAKKVRETFLNGRVFAWADACPKGTDGVVSGVVEAYAGRTNPMLDRADFDSSVLPVILASAGVEKGCEPATADLLYEATASTFKELNAERYRKAPEGPSEASLVLASAMARTDCPKDVTEYVKNNVQTLYSTIEGVLGKHADLKKSMAKNYASECFNLIADSGSYGIKFAEDFRGYLDKVMEQVTEAYDDDVPKQAALARVQAMRSRVFAETSDPEVKETLGREAESADSASLDCINTRKYLYDAGAEMEDVLKVPSAFDMCDAAQVAEVVDSFKEFFPDSLVDSCETLSSLARAGVNPNVEDDVSDKVIREFGVIIGFPICGDLEIEVVDFGFDPMANRHECEFQCKCGHFVMEGAAGWDMNEWKRRVSVAVTKAIGSRRDLPTEKALEERFTRIER